MEPTVEHWIEVLFDGCLGGLFTGVLTVLLGHHLEKRRSRAKEEPTGQESKSNRSIVTKLGLAILSLCLIFGAVVGTVYLLKTHSTQSPNNSGQITQQPVNAISSSPSSQVAPLTNRKAHDTRKAGKPVSMVASSSASPPDGGTVTIAERVTTIIAIRLIRDRKTIKPEEDFEIDLGASPTEVDLIMYDLEEEYRIKIPDSARRKLHTVGETIKYIEAKVSSAE